MMTLRDSQVRARRPAEGSSLRPVAEENARSMRNQGDKPVRSLDSAPGQTIAG